MHIHFRGIEAQAVELAHIGILNGLARHRAQGFSTRSHLTACERHQLLAGSNAQLTQYLVYTAYTRGHTSAERAYTYGTSRFELDDHLALTIVASSVTFNLYHIAYIVTRLSKKHASTSIYNSYTEQPTCNVFHTDIFLLVSYNIIYNYPILQNSCKIT